MNNTHDDGRALGDLDRLIADITGNARGDDEQFRAFHRAFGDGIKLPCNAFVIGEPVSVVAFDYDGNPRRGLTARCQPKDGSTHVVAAAEVVLAVRSPGTHLLAAYHKWLGLNPGPDAEIASPRRKRQDKATTADIDLSHPIELVVLSLKEPTARCRLIASDRVVTLRASRLYDAVPGEIVVVRPGKLWSYAGHPYLSGEIESVRLDVAALGFVPLKLQARGLWNPDEHYWGEEEEPIEQWAKPIIARGPRQTFEMEQVIPGQDPNDFDSDPILQSSTLLDSGDRAGARQILMGICQADLRCLDAHAHLGISAFDQPQDAIRHFAVGLRIGELSLGRDFDGLLPWGQIDNRPYLRCLHGFGLCLWRLKRFEEAERVFGQLLWLNPTDNQGARFVIDDVRRKLPWEDRRDEK